MWNTNAFIGTRLTLKRKIGFECALVMGFSEFPLLSCTANVAMFLLDHGCQCKPQQRSSIFYRIDHGEKMGAKGVLSCFRDGGKSFLVKIFNDLF